MDIGVRDLKEHLSEHLRRVEAGEVIRVTDRGRPVAFITPIAAGDPLRRGIDEGWIRPPVATGAIGTAPRSRATRRIADAVREDRGE